MNQKEVLRKDVTFSIIYQKHSASVTLGEGNLSCHPSTCRGSHMRHTDGGPHRGCALHWSFCCSHNSRGLAWTLHESELKQSLMNPRWHWHPTDISTGVINTVSRKWWALRYGRCFSVSLPPPVKIWTGHNYSLCFLCIWRTEKGLRIAHAHCVFIARFTCNHIIAHKLQFPLCYLCFLQTNMTHWRNNNEPLPLM